MQEEDGMVEGIKIVAFGKFKYRTINWGKIPEMMDKGYAYESQDSESRKQGSCNFNTGSEIFLGI